MTGRFKPHLEVLPSSQRDLWPQLAQMPALGFTLYGGTAIALRLGHRESVDFDFFSEQPLHRPSITTALPFIAQATTLQDEPNAWSLLMPSPHDARVFVKVSFFGEIAFGRVDQPDLTQDGVMQVASLQDLMATKLKVILQRAEAKDYRDIAAMIEAGASLPKGLAAARLLFGAHFQPSESLKALVYFGDGDLHSLSSAERQTLVQAAAAVRDLPTVTRQSMALR
jgi:hypothetical protein